MAGTPILTQAEDNMATLIAAMHTDNDYNYDWGTVNQPDLAKCVFPCAMITLEPDETNLDDLGGAHANAYLNEAFYKIRVVGKLPAETTTPIYEINEILLKALDDLKKLFGTGAGASLNGVVDSMFYRRSTRWHVQAGDIFIPKELHSFWRVQYTQDRTDPTQPDP